jgi:prepilin-type processing-associated H-X9-DG protein
MNRIKRSNKNKHYILSGCHFFTLIELLIIISIIAILASMLLPALKNAREKGKSVCCLNQLKQWGISLSFYTNDFNGYFVPWRNNPVPPTEPWSYILSHNNYMSNSNMYICPSAQGGADRQWWVGYIKQLNSSSPNNALGWEIMDYGYNFHIGNSARTTNAGRPVKQSEIKQSSLTMVLLDVYYNSNSSGFGCYYATDVQEFGGDGGWTATRHNNGANVLWADGHSTTQRVQNPLAPWASDPFRKGYVVGSPENHYDTE